jgi:uncharacterized protein
LELAAKRAGLRRGIARLGGVVVAYSGGVDSTLVAAVAHDVLGSAALAVTAASPAVPVAELEAAVRMAEDRGWAHRVVPTAEPGRQGYARNGPGRCYFCRTELFSVLEPIARARGATMVTGTNADDMGDHGPGLRAAAEHGVRAPLAERGLSKADVRDLSADLGLPTAEMPASPCLASRVAQGLPVTVEGLDRSERAEAFLRVLGLGVLWVRDDGDLVRIEVPGDQIARVVALREPIAARMAVLGFPRVTLDLAGVRSGSLTAVLPVRGSG